MVAVTFGAIWGALGAHLRGLGETFELIWEAWGSKVRTNEVKMSLKAPQCSHSEVWIPNWDVT